MTENIHASHQRLSSGISSPDRRFWHHLYIGITIVISHVLFANGRFPIYHFAGYAPSITRYSPRLDLIADSSSS